MVPDDETAAEEEALLQVFMLFSELEFSISCNDDESINQQKSYQETKNLQLQAIKYLIPRRLAS